MLGLSCSASTTHRSAPSRAPNTKAQLHRLAVRSGGQELPRLRGAWPGLLLLPQQLRLTASSRHAVAAGWRPSAGCRRAVLPAQIRVDGRTGTGTAEAGEAPPAPGLFRMWVRAACLPSCGKRPRSGSDGKRGLRSGWSWERASQTLWIWACDAALIWVLVVIDLLLQA